MIIIIIYPLVDYFFNLFNNEYLYDKVGNVTGLINSAGITSNDMAGTYAHSYKYDNLNRLIFLFYLCVYKIFQVSQY